MSESRYRYFQDLPTGVEISVGDLAEHLPPGTWTGSERDRDRPLKLECAEIFETSIPKIRLARLRELMPGCIGNVQGTPEWIVLPAAAIVSAYKPATHRVVLPALPPKPVEAPPEPKKEETPAGKATTEVTKPPVEESKPALPVKEAKETSEEPKSAKEPKPESPEPPPKKKEFVPLWHRLFGPKSPEPADTATSEQPAAPEKPAEKPAPVPLAKRPILPADEKALRDLFMTDDSLTVSGVLAHCAKLPGVSDCHLAKEDEILPSAPRSAPFFQWAGPAREALAKMPGVSPDMPVVTIHPNGSAVSLWLPAKFTFLVQHDDRGFPPGVMEKLHLAAAAIGRAIG